MSKLDDNELFANVDSGVFIDRYVRRFVRGLETDSVSIYEFDRMLLAEGGHDGVPDEIVWGTVRDGSKHIGMLSELPDDEDALREIQAYLHSLNANAGGPAVEAFSNYLQEHFASLSTITENALVEIPDPMATKVGDYPVVDVILYAPPDGPVTKTVEATLYRASFSVDDPDAVFEHVGRHVPSGDVERYAETVYRETVEAFEDELTATIVEDLDRESLEAAGYAELKEEPVPENANPLYAGASATFWQKEIWSVDGIDATTGFARVWFLAEGGIGVVDVTDGDFDADAAIDLLKAELA